MRTSHLLLLGCSLFPAWDAGSGEMSAERTAMLQRERLQPTYERLKRTATPKTPATSGDWLAIHPERGESFAEYVAHNPVRASGYNAFDVLQLGTFSDEEKRIAQLTIQYLRIYFGVPVRSRGALPLSAIPADARRRNPYEHQEQLLTTFILFDLLQPIRPRDSIGLIALTTSDLYPDEDWNFVFGQASLTGRTGVWSIARLGNAAGSTVERQRLMIRTIKTAVHELSHMLSMAHCTAYECVMNGSNHQEESDRAPIEPCPVCLQKMCWNTGCDPGRRATALLKFAQDHGLQAIVPQLRVRTGVLAPDAR